jgi:dTDP-4-dehydrorhamnose reductase
MKKMGLSGLYHVVAPEAISKYEFGVRIAELFGFDPALIQPSSVAQAGLRATRSANMTLSIAKLQQVLPHAVPNIQQGLEHFLALYQENYPENLRALSADTPLAS